MVINIAKLSELHCEVSIHTRTPRLCFFQFAAHCASVYGAVAVCHEILASLTTSFRRELAQIIARILTSNGNESFSSSALGRSSSKLVVFLSWGSDSSGWVRFGVRFIVIYVPFYFSNNMLYSFCTKF